MRLVFALTLAACSANDDVPAPLIGAVTPDRATPGTTVVVTGSAFCQLPHDDGDGDPIVCAVSGEVLFGDHLGVSLGWEDTQIMAEVPEAAPGDVAVRIQVNGRTSNAIAFTID